MAFSILSGTLFVPMRAIEAGFFSSLFSADDRAYANTNTNTNTINPPQSGDNLQNMALPQASVSPASILPDKSGKDGVKDNTTNDTNADTNIINNALKSSAGPMGISDGVKNADSSDETSVYVVRKGDSLAEIAKMFGISVNTILAANDLKKDAKIKENDVLFILPISGLEHTVIKGQTLQSIAKLYKVDVNDIASYNGIATDAKLAVGDKLMVPGAYMSDEGGDKPAPNLGSAVSRDKKYYETHPLQFLVDYFIYPLPLGIGRKTQGLHGPGNRGIDIGAPRGTPILASAGGVVSLAHTGWSGGYGNMIIIEHPNGTKTLYGHMSKIGTYTGASVSQGQVIGYVGSTGRSTGPHIHFEVFGARNPGADWSWAN